ncbi:putative Histidine kinase [Desulfosarcina cetonica]|nr:putative Histidine kinase [Desulfosarcina cetonica]
MTPLDRHTQRKIALDLVQRLADQTPIGVLATVINAILLSIFLVGVLPLERVCLWLVLFLLVCLARLVLQRYLNRQPLSIDKVGRHEAIYLFFLALSGSFWGVVPIFLFPESSVVHQVLIVLVLGGMVAGSVGVFASIMGVFYAFGIPTLVPVIIVFFSIGDRLHTTMGSFMIVFGAFMLVAAKRLNREIYAFLVRKYENIDLIDKLEQEVGERQLAENRLVEKNREIESIVAARTDELLQVNKKLQIEIEERIEAEAEQKKLATQLEHAQKMEVLGTMAGGVAHDLNNILSGIVSYPDLLLMQVPEGSPLFRPIQVMQESGKKAAAIVQDLLTLTRRGVLVKEALNLNEVIVAHFDTPEHHKMISFHPGVDVKLALEDDLPNIAGSRIHIEKTVMNLLSNAAEAMPDGGQIQVGTARCHLDRPLKGYAEVNMGDYVVLTVRDTGTGIKSADIDRIFEPFFTKKKMGRSGTGLGMAVVWAAVKDHNGYIQVESTEGRGTCFSLYFPITHEARTVIDAHESITAYQGRGETILVVDDIDAQRQIASDLLTQLGYRVTTAPNGEAALALLRKTRFDLLVLDMIMDPGMDGLDTYKAVVALHPGQRAIIASGFSETERVREAMRLGAGPYIKKPYTWINLGQAVRTALTNPT